MDSAARAESPIITHPREASCATRLQSTPPPSPRPRTCSPDSGTGRGHAGALGLPGGGRAQLTGAPLDPGGPACLLGPQLPALQQPAARERRGQTRGHALPPSLILHLVLIQPGHGRARRGLPRALSPGACPTPTAFRPPCEPLPLRVSVAQWEGGHQSFSLPSLSFSREEAAPLPPSPGPIRSRGLLGHAPR